MIALFRALPKTVDQRADAIGIALIHQSARSRITPPTP